MDPMHPIFRACLAPAASVADESSARHLASCGVKNELAAAVAAKPLANCSASVWPTQRITLAARRAAAHCGREPNRPLVVEEAQLYRKPLQPVLLPNS